MTRHEKIRLWSTLAICLFVLLGTGWKAGLGHKGLWDILSLCITLAMTFFLTWGVYGELGFKVILFGGTQGALRRSIAPLAFAAKVVIWLGGLIMVAKLAIVGYRILDFLEHLKEPPQTGHLWRVREMFGTDVLISLLPGFYGVVLKILLFDPCLYFAKRHVREEYLEVDEGDPNETARLEAADQVAFAKNAPAGATSREIPPFSKSETEDMTALCPPQPTPQRSIPEDETQSGELRLPPKKSDEKKG